MAIIPKVTEKDEIIPFALPDGGIGALPIQAGTEVYINAVGLHYNRELIRHLRNNFFPNLGNSTILEGATYVRSF